VFKIAYLNLSEHELRCWNPGDTRRLWRYPARPIYTPSQSIFAEWNP